MLSRTAQFISFLQSKYFRLLENVDLAHSCLLALICAAFLESHALILTFCSLSFELSPP